MLRPTASLVLILAFVPQARAQCIGYSGMVRISGNSYLTVNDRKNPIQPGHRLGVLTVTPKDGTHFHPLPVEDWGDKVEKEPSDLEAVCAIPDVSSEYLLVESGLHEKKYGRLFHVRVTRDVDGAWQVRCLKTEKLPLSKPNDKGTTLDPDQVEGVACLPGSDKGKPTLVLGQRGGKAPDGTTKAAQVVWGELDLATLKFQKRGSCELAAVKGFRGTRGCSDLHVEHKNNECVVWSVATHDPDKNEGPFHSVVYRAGVFAPDPATKELKFVPVAQPTIVYHVHGLKVEALAAPPTCIPAARFGIATDDENYGGIWRPLSDQP